MAAQAWFSSGDMDVAPGSTVVLQLTVVNLSDTTDSFTLTPTGMAAHWTTLRPATVTLFGGAQQVVDVEVSPPALPTTAAGPTSLAVRVAPQADPEQPASAETSIVIGDTHDRRVHVLQPAVRTRRRASFDVMVENRGNSLATCRLHLHDPSGRVQGRFDPPSVSIDPGTSALSQLTVRATSRVWRRPGRTTTLRIDADQSGVETASTTATLVQSAMLPEHVGARSVGVVVGVALLVGAWFWPVRPAIRDAARDAVRDMQPSSATTVPASTPATGDTTPSSGTPDADGTILNTSLAIEVAVGETASNEFAVPTGQVLHITDLVVQNPQGDQGSLIISRDDEQLFTYSLANVAFADVDQPLVTPIEVRAGERLVVTITCTGVGNPEADGCSSNVVLSGVLSAG